ncbi:MAG: hypothetical protein GY805_20250 [Chloroflexi bacterium]|nr:hypothetical protein [Chloroflexota bacterium]
MNSWSFFEAYNAIQLQHYGVHGEALIVDRWIKIYKGSEYYKFRYQWHVPSGSNEMIAFTGEGDASLESGYADIGTRITIRYLPNDPTVSHTEEDFADVPKDALGYYIFLNVFIILISPVFLWLEQPKMVRANRPKVI